MTHSLTYRQLIYTMAAFSLSVTATRNMSAQASVGQRLPEAPQVRVVAEENSGHNIPTAPSDRPSPEQAPAVSASGPMQKPAAHTRAEAEHMAIKNNPRVSVGRLLALAQHQVVRETRAAELPTATASITAVDAENAARISAGSLTSSRVFEHAGAGGVLYHN